MCDNHHKYTHTGTHAVARLSDDRSEFEYSGRTVWHQWYVAADTYKRNAASKDSYLLRFAVHSAGMSGLFLLICCSYVPLVSYWHAYLT